MRLSNVNKTLKGLDTIVKSLVWISIISYMLELAAKSENSYNGLYLFLCVERIIAIIFTIEYGLRVAHDKLTPDDHPDFLTSKYITSPLGIIDLLSILPFWIGFFIPPQYLGIIRTLRIVRFGKFFRYSRHLQIVALGFIRAWPNLRALLFSFLVIGLFNTLLIHEVEKYAQPEVFGDIRNCAWYVLVSATTVGYGDMSPITPLGKLTASITLLIPALMIYASIVGVVGAEFVKVVDEERDPNIDPLELFHKEWASQSEK